MQVKRGNVSSGMDNLNRALVIYRSELAKDSKNSYTLAGVADTYSGLGMAYSSLAIKGAPDRWQEARRWYQLSLDTWTDLQGRGALEWSDKDKPRQTSAEIARCDEFLAK